MPFHALNYTAFIISSSISIIVLRSNIVFAISLGMYSYRSCNQSIGLGYEMEVTLKIGFHTYLMCPCVGVCVKRENTQIVDIDFSLLLLMIMGVKVAVYKHSRESQ